jgi:hypothetical protein
MGCLDRLAALGVLPTDVTKLHGKLGHDVLGCTRHADRSADGVTFYQTTDDSGATLGS